MMKYVVSLIAGAFILFQVNALIAGEYYQYMDQDGNMIFTDDLSKVPKEKQTGMKTFQSVAKKPKSSADAKSESTSGAEEIQDAEVPAESIQEPREETAEETAVETPTEIESAPDQAAITDQTLEQGETPAEEASQEINAGEPVEESAIPESASETPNSSNNQEVASRFDREKKDLDQQLDRLQKEKEQLEKQDVSKMKRRELNAHEEKVKDLNARIELQKKEEAQFQEKVRQFNNRIMKKDQKPEESGISSEN